MKKASNKSNISIIRDYLDGNRPFTQFGYVPEPEKPHKEGETWTDKNGVEWIQTKTGKQSKKLHSTYEVTRKICSKCKKDIQWSNDKNDDKFFNKTGKCYDCVIEDEHKLRVEGKFDTYEKIKVIQNQRSFLKDLQIKIEESIVWMENADNKLRFLNEDGTYEDWSSVDRTTLLETAKKDLIEVKKTIIICNESISMLESEFNEPKR